MELSVDWNSLCRICLTSFESDADTKLISICDTQMEDDSISLHEKISICTNLNINFDSIGPKKICINCVKNLGTAYKFYSTAHSSNAIIEQIVSIEPKETEEITVATARGSWNYVPPTGLRVRKIPDKMSNKQSTLISSDNLAETASSEQESIIKEVDDDSNDSIISEYLDEGEVEEISVGPKSSDHVIATIPKAPNEPTPMIEKVATQIDPEGKTRTLLKVNRQTNKERLKCSYCDKSYKYNYSLVVHEKRHSSQKDYECEICKKKFVILFELKRHQRTHSGEKPYACKFCEKKFSDYGSKTKHERIHTGVRPYSCTICGMAFAYSHVLKTHMYKHTGEKKYACLKCEKRFTKNHHLKSHMTCHEPKKVNKVMVQIRDDHVVEVIT